MRQQQTTINTYDIINNKIINYLLRAQIFFLYDYIYSFVLIMLI